MEFKIDLGLFNGVFAVPNSIADEYIKIATGDNLKVLLYCLRHAGTALSAGEISRATAIPPDNVTSSIEFWNQRGLFNNDSAGIPTETSSARTELLPLLERDHEFTPAEISGTIKSSKDVEYLFQRGEDLYGRPLKHNEQKALAVIIEDIGMNPGVTLMLMEYCFSIDRTTPRYIKKVAGNWIEQGIDSIEAAENEIKQLKEYHSAEGELVRMLEIKAIPDNKKQLFKKWLSDFNFTKEIIYDAYQITLEKTGKLEYNYMDKILCGWNVNGIGAKDPKSAAAPGKNQSKTVVPPSFDLDDLDKQIMQEYTKK